MLLKPSNLNRDDYQEFAALVKYSLEGTEIDPKFRRPGAIHRGRGQNGGWGKYCMLLKILKLVLLED